MVCKDFLNIINNPNDCIVYFQNRIPKTRKQLAAYVNTFLGWRIPDQAMCQGHCSPMDYLAWSFLDRHDKRDAIIWANRGGGKTQLGAVASLLECLFLPQCQVRILGGSEEQSSRMYDYLKQAIDVRFSNAISGSMTQRGCRFRNGSDVQVLAQSDASVRGHHVQRLRCDELELFDRDVWQGAQFITQSKHHIPSRLEVFSTMHRPAGLMHELVTTASEKGMKIFSWCLWEVIEKCVDRQCSQCPLWEDCRGKAKRANGYYPIDDAIAQKRRSSHAAWQSEMLCQRPNREELVFPEFHPNVHVCEVGYDANLPLYRALDFGFEHPLVCLFLQVDLDGTIYVIDEHVKHRTSLSRHAELIQKRYPYPIEASFCDPAGKQRREITTTSVIQELVALGIPTKCRASRILDGLEMIRSSLAPADGKVRLKISSKCQHLIRSFNGYRYKKQACDQLSELPYKDGVHDHTIDALRYFFVNYYGKKIKTKMKWY